jgi:hypothetical protein
MSPTIPESIAVTPSNVELDVGQIAQLTARVKGCDGSILSDPVGWSSARSAIAKIDAVGVVTGVSEGTTTVKASAGSISRDVSVNVNAVAVQAPSVAITDPSAGATFATGASISFQGLGTDVEDVTLSGAALVWKSSLDGQIGTGTSFSRNDLSTGSHRVTLTGTDSDNLSDSTTVSITVLEDTNAAPTAMINSPTNGANFDEVEPISFSGSASDPEDGALTGPSLVWTSSRDGQIGTGTSFTRSNASAGDHTIRLIATESDGLADTATVSIAVATRPDPAVTITSPADASTHEEGASISFTGSATDADGNSLAGTALVWTSSSDGPIGTGVSVTKSNLSVGAHTVTLTATDGQGQSGTAQISIKIDENHPPSVSIETPTDGSTFNEGTGIAFRGSASDPEDGKLLGAALVWSSDLDGDLGTGTAVDEAHLSIGTHRIFLTATDSGGASDTTAVTIIIEDDLTDLFVAAFRSEFGIDIPAPIREPTDFTPTGQIRAGWTSTAFIGDLLYRVYIAGDSTADATIIGPLEIRPEGTQRVAVAAIDYGNTNIGEVFSTFLPMAQDSINQKHRDYASAHGFGEAIVNFVNLNRLIPSTELHESFSPNSPLQFIEEVVAHLTENGLPRSAYDILMVLDLDADSPGGAYYAAGIGHGYWVYAPCSTYSCIDPFTTVNGLRSLLSPAYRHEIAHLWGYEHMWSVEVTEGGYANDRCPYSITATCESLFGWVDSDGDGIPEIRDPTPYGRP